MNLFKRVLKSIFYFFQGVLEMIILTSYLTLTRLFSADMNPFNTSRFFVITVIIIALVDVVLKFKSRNVAFFIGFLLAICPVILVVSAMPVQT